jgi:hypothetical protein
VWDFGIEHGEKAYLSSCLVALLEQFAILEGNRLTSHARTFESVFEVFDVETKSLIF